MNNFINNSLQNVQNPLQQAYMAQVLNALVNGGGVNLQNAYKAAQESLKGNSGVQNTHNGCNLNIQDHLKYVDSLVLLKIIDENTGKSIKQNITATFNNNRALPAYDGLNPSQNNASKVPFDYSKSDFLRARECLLNYLQNADIELDEEDLKNIESVVLELEKAAMLRQKAQNPEDALDILNKSNEIAKNRLLTGSMQNSGAQNPPDKTFTRDEIAKMSTAEFIKNEPVINYQLQNGLL